MTFKESIKLTESADYRERFVAEYVQTKVRYEKLRRMLVKLEAGTLNFTPNCPAELLREQQAHMGMYLNKLEIRAEIEIIPLPSVEI